MGKAAVFAIVAFGMLATYYSIGTKKSLAETDEELAVHQYEVLSRNAALAGYERARQALAEDFSAAPSAISGQFNGSDYEVRIARSGDIAEVTSTGVTLDSHGDPIDYHVTATVERELIHTIAEEAPEFMRYALLSEYNLELDGSILTDLYVQGDAGNTLNANMHTNGDLSISGNAVDVRGFGTFTGSGWANPSDALQGSFDPYYNPTDVATASQAPRIEIPPFDVADFVSKVTVDQSTGSTTLSGTYSLGGTREDPFIWRVTGDLDVTGNTKIDGYVMFIVEDDVDFGANFEAGNTGYDGGDESSMAVYVGDDVSLRGNTKIYGQIVAEGDVSFVSGTPRVFGSITTRGYAYLSGTPKIYYRLASPALTTIYQDPEIRLSLIAYSEW